MRPLGMILLTLALGWSALGGLVFSIVSPTLAWAGLPWMLYEIADLVYAGSAILAAVGVAFAVGAIPMFTLSSDEPWRRWILQRQSI